MTRQQSVEELLASSRARRAQSTGMPIPDLFPGAWLEAPAASDEQHAVSLPGATLQGDYDAWRATPAGTLAFNAFVRRALTTHLAGQRVSAKAIWEQVRADLRVKLNNNHHALAVREAEQVEPRLRGAFEKRQRHAA